MNTNIYMKGSGLIFLAAMLCVGGSIPAVAGNPPTTAAPAAAVKSPATSSSEKQQPIELGKINVKAMRELVKTLQIVKVALKTPYSNDLNAVVCSIHAGGGIATLECGTNSFYLARRDACSFGIFSRMIIRGVSCYSTDSVSHTWGDHNQYHQWHSVRMLNMHQLVYLRKLLKELPAPGKGDVVVVNDKGKMMVKVKTSEQTAGTDGN